MMSAIDLKNTSFTYDKQTTVLSINSLQVAHGKKVFIYGPSGCGKSTLLGLVSGILAPTSGTVSLLGQNLANMTSSQRDKFRGDQIGYIFQMFNLVPYLSVIDNICLPIQMSHEKAKRLQNKYYDEAIELCSRLEISHLVKKPVTELSVGQQQRVAAARAFMGKPPIIIADEPTSALDFNLREQFCNLLFNEALRYNATVLFVSHDQSLRSLFDENLDLTTINQTRN